MPDPPKQNANPQTPPPNLNRLPLKLPKLNRPTITPAYPPIKILINLKAKSDN